AGLLNRLDVAAVEPLLALVQRGRDADAGGGGHSAVEVEEAERGGVPVGAGPEADEGAPLAAEVVGGLGQRAPVGEGVEGVLDGAVACAGVGGGGAVDDAQGNPPPRRGARGRPPHETHRLVHGSAVEVEGDGGAVIGEAGVGHGGSYGAS